MLIQMNTRYPPAYRGENQGAGRRLYFSKNNTQQLDFVHSYR